MGFPTPTVRALLLALAGLAATVSPALASDGTLTGPTPPRLALVDGDVSFWRLGSDDWTSARANMPLAAGDAVFAGDGGTFEIQSGPRTFVRGGPNTELGLESLERDYMQLKVTGGRVVLDLRQLPRGQAFEVATPGAAFTVDGPGYYRIDVDESTSAFIARRGGTARVVSADGATVEIGEGQRVAVATAGDRPVVGTAPDLDAWDRWNDDRTARLGVAPRSAQYVPRDVAGVDDLDRYGDWRDVPDHGHVWVPRDTTPDWAPYSTGRWVYDPRYEWSWVDDAPWGWAPYHYGRWVNTGTFWGWSPGPVVATSVYAPALVAFFGAPGVGLSVGAGLPFVSWVALGYGEPVIPWWGGARFAGRPYWGGWGGPRYVNNVVVNATAVIDVRKIDRFRNMDVRNAMIGIDRGQFGRGRGQHVRLAPEQNRFEPVHGQLGVTPVAASLAPSDRKGRRPPEDLRARQVVATRPPEDARGRLRAHGLDADAAATAPAPRIARDRRGPQARRAAARELRPRASSNPPPHGARARSGRPPTRPASAAPPSPAKAQHRAPKRTQAGRPRDAAPRDARPPVPATPVVERGADPPAHDSSAPSEKDDRRSRNERKHEGATP